MAEEPPASGPYLGLKVRYNPRLPGVNFVRGLAHVIYARDLLSSRFFLINKTRLLGEVQSSSCEARHKTSVRLRVLILRSMF